MRLFAWLGRWTRSWHKAEETPAASASAYDEDRSSMAELVSILARIDRMENSRAAR